MEIDTEAGELTVERKRGMEQFEIQLTYYEPDDSMYTITKPLSTMVDDSVNERSDIDQSATKSAVRNVVDHLLENHDTEIDEVVSVEIISTQALRKTPHDERQYRTD